jgi:threonylcarbamoyladenosine tRNA methylthiotransferase MtaB
MNIYLDTIGCRLNQAEIEIYANQFRAAGHVIVGQPAGADLAVINTCAVTLEAASDSRQKIRQMVRAGVGQVIVTGCWATLDEKAARLMEGVAGVTPNELKDRLVTDFLGLPAGSLETEALARAPLPGGRMRTRAFIKVQDGCDNRCAFCVTTLARGASHSRNTEQIIADIRLALRGGAREIVLTGVHLGSWGRDFEKPLHLADLARTILQEGKLERLRLSSLEPWDLDENFFSLWQDRRLCRHLHLPLQSGCAATLRRMARKTTPQSYAALLEQARRFIPDVAITTDVMVGFPGESEMEFNESLEFVRTMRFAAGHVFSYSPRPGTLAERLPDPVSPQVKKQRSAGMRSVLQAASLDYRRRFIGQQMPVLWEAAEDSNDAGWLMSGLTDNYLRVNTLAQRDLWNQITPVTLTALDKDGLTGVLTIP